MGSIIGNKLKISVFGQSHSEAIGVVIDGFPAGFSIDREELAKFIKRRSPGNAAFSTARREADTPHFISGLVDGKTCGAPIAAVIANTDVRSEDYQKIYDVPRPSHADFSARMKFGGAEDVRGGGHFSGRLTAPLCVAGALCEQYLKKRNIQIFAHIASIAAVSDEEVDWASPDLSRLSAAKNRDFSVISPEKGEEMQEKISEAKERGDSVGGVVECIITGVPAGIGNPMFEGIENRIASMIFGIPAVRGIEFGKGFASALLLGSQNNDEFYYAPDGSIKTASNRHGGVLGGISTGMPIVFRTAFKPTPSIAIEQNSISFEKKENTPICISGRHDPCSVPRAVVCVEAAAAIGIMDLLLEEGRY